MRGDGRGADAEKRIEQAGRRALAVDADALLDESDRKSRGVGAVLVARLDGLVGDKPGVSPAAQVLAAGVAPAGDVGFVNVRHPGGAAVELDAAGFRQVEDILVAVVDEALRVDRLEMPGADLVVGAGLDGDGFHPVEGVLEGEKRIRPVR